MLCFEEFHTDNSYQYIFLLRSLAHRPPPCQISTACPSYGWIYLDWPCGRNCLTLWDQTRRTAWGNTSGPAPVVLWLSCGTGCRKEPPSSALHCENVPRRCAVPWWQCHSLGLHNTGSFHPKWGWQAWVCELQPEQFWFLPTCFLGIDQHTHFM